MRTIQRLTILAGLPLLVLALGATGAKAQGRSGTEFVGTFTLPIEAQWGGTIMPAGEYSLYYRQPLTRASFMVEVIGKKKGSPHVFILPQGVSDASATRTELVCVRQGSSLIVRALEMPEIGTVALFALPHGEKLAARDRDHKGYRQLAEAPMLLERIPVAPNGK